MPSAAIGGGRHFLKGCVGLPVLRTRLLRQIVAAFLALVIAGMFFVPLLSVVKMAFTADGGFSFASFIKILTSARQYHVIANTLIINIASSLLAATLGVSAAYCIAYTKVQFTRDYTG